LRFFFFNRIKTMYKLLKNKFLLSILLPFFCVVFSSFAQIPEGYYNGVQGKSGAELKTALFNIIKNPRFESGKYFAARDFFNQADRTEDGCCIWDIYSSIRLPNWTGSGENALNREHNMPKSWFGISSGAEDSESIGCDYNNLYPSNAKANGAKLNYPLGEVNPDACTFDNGVSRVGKSKISEYNGTVFEPDDEYKGDFARNYMYMVTCYEDYASRWTSTGTSSMLKNQTFPTLNTYAVALLMRWHEQDPVSEKEIKRNEAVYQKQGNRNPFVDHPEYASYIWGGRLPEDDLVPFSTGYDERNKTLHISLNEIDNSPYTVYFISGLPVLNGVLNSDGVIDCSPLPRGMYILILYSQGRRYTAKFAVTKPKK